MNHPTARWIIESDPNILQIARRWPFLAVDGDAITYVRHDGVLSQAAVVDDGSPAPDNSDTVETVSYGFNNIVTAYKVNAADLDRYGNEAEGLSTRSRSGACYTNSSRCWMRTRAGFGITLLSLMLPARR